MENTIDLRKTGAENIIVNSVKHSSQHIIPVRENGSFIVETNIYMTARQADYSHAI
jgi:predicted  nucleic acid-binding Zn-ribbon protein